MNQAFDDDRCIHALDSRDGSDYTLPDNALPGNAALRDELVAHMRCWDCGEKLTPRHYTDRRDHFYHAGKTDHCSRENQVEGWWHKEGKRVLREWLEQLGIPARAEAWSKDRSARADVLAQWLHSPVVGEVNGATVVFEVQYGALPEATWTNRHRSWSVEPAADMWLFGHFGHHAIGGPALGTVTLNTTHEAVVAAGLPLLWLNPESRTVGTALVERSHKGKTFRVPPEPTDRHVHVDWVALEECALTESGLSHPEHRRALMALAELHRLQTEPEPEPVSDRGSFDDPTGTYNSSGHRASAAWTGMGDPPGWWASPPPVASWEQLWQYANDYGVLQPHWVHYVHNREPLPIAKRMERWRTFADRAVRTTPTA